MYKNFLLSFLFGAFAVVRSYCQSGSVPLPPFTLIPHYLVTVNFNTTTVLVFPAAVRPVDRGDRDILAQKQPGVDNVLKLKAARKDFPVTNLHVFTADGRIYAFDVVYSDSLATTRDLSGLLDNRNTFPPGIVQLSGEAFNSAQLTELLDSFQMLPVHVHGPVNHRDKMIIRLQRIAFAGPLIFVNFRLANRSNLDYNIDFFRMYIRDRQKAKRTSVQEHEVYPVYSDTLRVIPGRTAVEYTLVIPAFTLTAGKQFLVEAYEKNGGRTLSLDVSNKVLFKATKL